MEAFLKLHVSFFANSIMMCQKIDTLSVKKLIFVSRFWHFQISDGFFINTVSQTID